MKPVLDDLLQPTLSADLDATRFRSPWNPALLRYVAFFAWPLGAGVMFALNYRRLARERAARWTIAGTIAAFAGLLVVAWVLSGRGEFWSEKQSVSELRLACMVVFMLGAIALSRDQSKAFRAYRMADGKPAPLLAAALAAIVLNLLVFVGALLVVVGLRVGGGGA